MRFNTVLSPIRALVGCTQPAFNRKATSHADINSCAASTIFTIPRKTSWASEELQLPTIMSLWYWLCCYTYIVQTCVLNKLGNMHA